MTAAWTGEHTIALVVGLALSAWIWVCIAAAVVAVLRWGFRGRR